MKRFLPLVLAGTCVQPALACDLCSVYAATQAQGETGHGFFGGVAEQYTYFHTLQIGGHDVPNEGNQFLNSLISQAFVGYNFSDRAGIQLNLPVVYRSYGYESTRGHEFGIGDLFLLGNFRLYERQTRHFTFAWTALGGVKFPTGSTSQLDPSQEEFAPGIGGHDLTLGSGSWDGVVGTGVFGRWKHVFVTGAMQYAARSEGAFDYRFANDWTWMGGPGIYLLLSEDHSLSLQAMVSGESKGQDTVSGTPMDDTAITSVFVGPQLNYTWGTRLSAQLGGDLPVSIVSSGEQIVPTFRIRAALTWRF
jgi:hypothetical protein